MLELHYRDPDTLKADPKNPRTHSNKQIRQVADSISACGFAVPILVDEELSIIAGHARLAAAKILGLKTVPVVILSGLSAARKRALMLADNRIAANAGWDRELLAIEIPELTELLGLEGLEISITGFEAAEIDMLATDFELNSSEPPDHSEGEGSSANVVTRAGDLWQLGKHRLLCADARDPNSLTLLLGGEQANMAFNDPPYNLKICGVVGRGSTKHEEFAMASGEMSSEDFIDFLVQTLGNAVKHSKPGALHYICMDWRHLQQLFEAVRRLDGAIIALVVWVKSNAGQGSFYRSQHELVIVFRVGQGSHLNNIQLGRHGRSRSNVWKYPGVNSFRAGRMDELRVHPTVKPIAMVADAIKDCTCRGDIVLDLFGGSGTTLLAAERVGRRGYLMEIEPSFVDVAVRRWQSFTQKDAVHARTGVTFEEQERHFNPAALNAYG